MNVGRVMISCFILSLACAAAVRFAPLNESVAVAVCFACGAALGAFHFCGLWRTVDSFKNAAHPQVLLFASVFARLAFLLGVMYVAGDGKWQRFVAAAAGILLSRVCVVSRMKKQINNQILEGNG